MNSNPTRIHYRVQLRLVLLVLGWFVLSHCSEPVETIDEGTIGEATGYGFGNGIQSRVPQQPVDGTTADVQDSDAVQSDVFLEDTEEPGEGDTDLDGSEETDVNQETDVEEEGIECSIEQTFCPASQSCCSAEEVCLSYGCQTVGAPCVDDSECFDDTYCDPEAGACIPWGSGPKGVSEPACTKAPTPGVFFPTLQCEWSAPPEGDAFPSHKSVLGSAVSGRLLPIGGNSGGASGTTGGPAQVAFISYAGTDGGLPSASCCGIIRVIDGKTCAQLYSLDDAFVVGGGNLALGDLNEDGSPEIVAMAEGGGLVAFHYVAENDDFEVLWTSTLPDGSPDSFPGTGVYRWAGPSIADIFGDDRPEILLDGAIYSADGVLLVSTPGWSGYQQGVFPVVADADMDGKPDVFFGPQPYEVFEEGETIVPKAGYLGSGSVGHIALADFGAIGNAGGILPDDAAEVVLISSGSVSLLNLVGEVLWGPISLPGGGTGGPPTVADFDGDGQPEIAAAGATAYTVFDLDCIGSPLPEGCTSEGVLWSQASQDQSSNKTGSSVYDFEGDGQAEAVYGDECFLRVYNGKSGEVLYSAPRSSCTWHEMPIIADVDGDYRTEIVIGSNLNCSVSCPTLDPIFGGLRCDDESQCASGVCAAGLCRCSGDDQCSAGTLCGAPLSDDGLGQVCRSAHTGKKQGIHILTDAKDSWVYSRPIWNQHAYHATNVNDDGTIPPRSQVKTNWTTQGMNHFRQNAQGAANPVLAPDLTIEFTGTPSCEGGVLSWELEVCNRGALPAAAGVATTVIVDGTNVSGSTLVDLQPGECEAQNGSTTLVSTPWSGSIQAIVDGNDEGAILECIEGNNQTTGIFLECAP